MRDPFTPPLTRFSGHSAELPQYCTPGASFCSKFVNNAPRAVTSVDAVHLGTKSACISASNRAYVFITFCHILLSATQVTQHKSTCLVLNTVINSMSGKTVYVTNTLGELIDQVFVCLFTRVYFLSYDYVAMLNLNQICTQGSHIV